MERETGIEPATNSLGSCDSTTELLPLSEGHSTIRPAGATRRSQGSRTPRKRRLLVTTLNELKAIAALASTGLSRTPKPG